jgi:F-type H+-transporting ATPase subunit b
VKRTITLLFFTILLAVAASAAETTVEGEHGPNLDIWKWVNFAILASVLGWGIAKVAPGFFRSRTEEIQRGIAEATRIRQDAETRAAKMELRMASLQSEIDQLRTDARTEMAQEGERLRKEAEAQILRIQAHGEHEIEALTKHAEQSLRAYAGGLALDLAEQRIRERMTPGTQDTLVDGFIRQIGQQRAASEVRR